MDLLTEKTVIETKNPLVKILFFFIWDRVESISFYRQKKDKKPAYTIKNNNRTKD